MLSVNRSLLAGHHAKTAPLAASGGGFLSESDAVSAALLEAIEDFASTKKVEYVLLRLLAPLSSAEDRGWSLMTSYSRFLIELDGGEDAIWRRVFRDKTRNQVRKAQTYGFEILDGGVELAEELGDVLLRGMRELGSPAPGAAFFRDMMAVFPGKVSFLVIRDAGTPIAASVIAEFQGVVSVPWAITLSAYRPSCVNTLLYWESIKLAVRKNARIFDMGRSAEGQGTFDFKRRLGGERAQLYYYSFSPKGARPRIPDGTSGWSLPRRVWGRMPLPLAAMMTRRAYREVV